MTGASASGFSTAHLDYLQRIGLEAPRVPAVTPRIPKTARRLLRIEGRGDLGEVESRRAPHDDPRITGARAVLAGLYSERVPVAYALSGTPAGVQVSIGTWVDAVDGEASTGELADARAQALTTVLDVAHAGLTAVPVEPIVPVLPFSGLVLGVPTLAATDGLDGSTSVDRLLWAMRGGTWSALLLAEPIDEGYASQLRQGALDQDRAAQAAARSLGVPSPLADHYSDMLKALVRSLSEGLAVGTWRTGVFLSGDRHSYYRLSAAWRAVFSGSESEFEPLRVWTDDRAGQLVADWSLPYEPAPAGPGRYRHPFRHQTLLTSTQLSGVVELPQRETTGFRVTTLADFDVVTSPSTAPTVSIGEVVERSRPTGTKYSLSIGELTRHAFVAGVTGSGKTTTIRAVLEQLDAVGIPYLVIEPTKREYRSMRSTTAHGEPPAVFTLGDERVSPFRLNPFEVPVGTTVGEHLDLIRSVFATSSGMWTPLPQVLERCLHRIYADSGFDPVTGHNPRLEPGRDPRESFPTLSSLSAAVRRVVPTLGYDERVAADIQAALLTRVDSLRVGGKGLMLDGRRSTPLAPLLREPTVLELESVADDDDKAFLMGLFLTRLVEHRRHEGPAAGLRHLLVVEEAHRLLAAPVGIRRQEEGDAKGKAVETFGHILAELRAYGQGVLIADQIPTKLLPDVLKNTGLKIAHRTVAADDRAALAGAMAMTERQALALTSMPVGQAVLFGENDDHGVLVSVPRSISRQSPSAVEIAEQMRAWRRSRLGLEMWPPYDNCDEACANDAEICGVARRLVDEPALQRAVARLVLSSIDDPLAVDRLWPDLLAVVRARKPPNTNEQLLMASVAVHAASWLAGRRGDQASWSYSDTASLAATVRQMLLDRLADRKDGVAQQSFLNLMLRLSARTTPPYQACEAICRQQPPTCLYRADVADLVASGEQAAAWRRADIEDAVTGNGGRRQSWEVAQDAAYALIEFPEPDWPQGLRVRVSVAARRTALCFAQQVLAADPLKSPRTARRILERLLREADR